MSFRSLITALGLNAVPALGWFVGEWSGGTMLVLYWIETLIGTLLVALRIVLHRNIRPSEGHWSYQAPPQGTDAPRSSGSSYLSAFLVPTLIFTGAHGFFLAVLGGILIAKKNLTQEVAIDPNNLLAGLIGIAIFQAVDFFLDLIWLRTRPFAWIERLGQQTVSRVFVIHLTIMGGMAAVMFTGANRHFFGVFIILKTMLNLSLVTPQYQPKTPPAWLSNLMDRVKTRKNEKTTFAEFWVKTDEQEAARVARNEKALKT